MAVNTHPSPAMDNRRMLLPTNHIPIYCMVTPTYLHSILPLEYKMGIYRCSFLYNICSLYSYYLSILCYYVIKTKSLKTTEKSPPPQKTG